MARIYETHPGSNFARIVSRQPAPACHPEDLRALTRTSNHGTIEGWMELIDKRIRYCAEKLKKTGADCSWAVICPGMTPTPEMAEQIKAAYANDKYVVTESAAGLYISWEGE